MLGDEEVYAGPGDLVVNLAGSGTPSGLEELFTQLGMAGEKYDLSALPALAASYGSEVDFQGTADVAGWRYTVCVFDQRQDEV